MGKGSTAKRKKEAARLGAGRTAARHNDKPLVAGTDEPIVFAPPLRPQRSLFLALSVLLALWVAFLLFTYFSSVYRHASVNGTLRGGTAGVFPSAPR